MTSIDKPLIVHLLGWAGWLVLIAGGFTFLYGMSENMSVLGTGAGLLMAGALLLALCFVMNTLNRIEHHIRPANCKP